MFVLSLGLFFRLCLNRTFMELKSPARHRTRRAAYSLNRTFMELKYDKLASDVNVTASQSYLYGIEIAPYTGWKTANGGVSIVPLWN